MQDISRESVSTLEQILADNRRRRERKKILLTAGGLFLISTLASITVKLLGF